MQSAYLPFKHPNILHTSDELSQSIFFLESIIPKISKMKSQFGPSTLGTWRTRQNRNRFVLPAPRLCVSCSLLPSLFWAMLLAPLGLKGHSSCSLITPNGGSVMKVLPKYIILNSHSDHNRNFHCKFNH